MSPTTISATATRWSTHAGFLAAAVGSAVGLGNIWRFPYVIGQNGGGTFLIAYLIAIAVCGLPLAMFELAAGRQYRRGILGTIQQLNPKFWLIGMGIGIMGLVILSYYLVVTGWTLAYFFATPLGQDTTFTAFTGSWTPLIFFFIAAGVTFVIVLLGVNKGIEWASKLLMPLLALIVLGLAGYGLTLAGRNESLAFIFQPDFSELLKPLVWARAFSQAFFSLGVGMGVLLTYGGYLSQQSNIPKSATLIAGADTVIALFAGLAIFPIVFTFGYSPEAGAQLAFEILPTIFDQMNQGILIGTLFYLLLFIAATTSAVSILQMAVTVLAEGFGWPHPRSTLVLLLPLLVLGSLSALSYSPASLELFGRPMLDLLDDSMGTYGLLIGGLLTSIALFWLGKPELLVRQLERGAKSRWLKPGIFLGRYVLPMAVTATIVALILSKV